jgi:predicted phage tail component-like protein
MGVFGGKFLGFSYAGFRSEELGIIRTIQDRFEIPLTPPIKDTTAEVPNYSGVYFWGSDYDRRNINIPFAFDGITESQLSTIKKLLNSRKVHQLIFDEEPEKIYPAVMTGQSKLDYVAFDVFIEGNLERVYRGTGNFQLVGYTPYTRSTAKFAEELG